MRRSLGRVLLLLSAAPLAACSFGAGTVTRVADYREFEGRAISSEAYGDYARGALLEAAGDDRRALSAYQAALSEDPGAPEIHARLGAVRCRLSRSAKDMLGLAATRSLQRALELDPESSTAWAETSHCEARRGRPREAYEAAQRVAEFDPLPIASTLLVSARAEAAGDVAHARVWLDELVVREPQSREAWSALLAFAARQRDAGRALRARAALKGLGAVLPARPDEALKMALSTTDLPAARSAATRLRLAPGALAAELAERGSSQAAAEQAALVLSADPDDANAWIANTVAADLGRNLDELARALAAVPESPSALSPTAVRLYAALLERLVGPEARAAWLAAQPR
ncbi:MAG TPA: tetratricopeptide repeat protein [Polyangiaceae bacterium]|nr:tetratricopeptide repeat protein [Polyangiaceae bacterium]